MSATSLILLAFVGLTMSVLALATGVAVVLLVSGALLTVLTVKSLRPPPKL